LKNKESLLEVQNKQELKKQEEKLRKEIKQELEVSMKPDIEKQLSSKI
jgi:hypothetical protein